MNKKLLIIINGKPTAGKDTVVLNCEKYFSESSDIPVPIQNLSSIDLVRQAATILGWDGRKDPMSRNFLSDLKDLSTKYNNGPFGYVTSVTISNDYPITFAHVREPEEIEKLYEKFKSEPEHQVVPIRLYVDRNVHVLSTNHADNNTDDQEYDYVIQNHGSLEELYRNTEFFIKKMLELAK